MNINTLAIARVSDMFIYKITNKINGKSYVGLDTGKPEEQRRWRSHKYSRRTSPMIIDKALAKYGPDNFNYEVIDTATDVECLLKLEAYWVDHYETIKNGYNRIPGGRASHMSTKTPEERYKIIHELNRKRWDNATEEEKLEHSQKIAASISPEEREKRRHRAINMWADPDRAAKRRSNMKKKANTRERKEISINNLSNITEENRFSKKYQITDPHGKVFSIKNLSNFCRDNAISYGCMLMMANNRLEHYRDWKCRKI